MKKVLCVWMAVALFLGMLGANAETLGELDAKMSEAATDVASASFAMSFDVDIALDMGEEGGRLPVQASGQVALDYTAEPMACQVYGAVDASIVGTDVSVPIEAYVVPDLEGTPMVYVKNPQDDEWEVSLGHDLDLSMLGGIGEGFSFTGLSALGVNLTLAPGTVKINNVQCYDISTVIDSDTVSGILATVGQMANMDLLADENVSLMLTLLNGIRMNIHVYVNASSYKTERVHLDFNGSDLTSVNALIAALADEVTDMSISGIELNVLAVDIDLGYNTVDAIELPVDAFSKAIDEYGTYSLLPEDHPYNDSDYDTYSEYMNAVGSGEVENEAQDDTQIDTAQISDMLSGLLAGLTGGETQSDTSNTSDGAVAAPSVEIFDNGLFSFIVPATWRQGATTSVQTSNSVSFHCVAVQKVMGEEAGTLCTIVWNTTNPGEDYYPDADYLGEHDGNYFYILYPTDLQYNPSDVSATAYETMAESVDDLADMIEFD